MRNRMILLGLALLLVDNRTVGRGGAGQENGKSVYSLLSDGKLEVVDSVKQKDGSWKEFGRFVVSREQQGVSYQIYLAEIHCRD